VTTEEDMPIYEYYCSKCEKIFEELILGAPKGIKCPSCGNAG
jgi:putative FmdB family regulatory protein